MDDRRLAAFALLQLAVLAWLAGRPAPSIDLADAALHEGQSVRVQGMLLRTSDGTRLVEGTHALDVQLPDRDDGPLPSGTALELRGDLWRRHGVLTLRVADAKALQGEGEGVALADLAADPQAWEGRSVRVAGEVRAGTLRQDGVAIELGEGPWPGRGWAEAAATLAYDPACACHVLHAAEAAPWTP